MVRLPWPEPLRVERGVEGVVVHVDRFGNLVTNLPAPMIAPDSAVNVGDRRLVVRHTYGDVASGEAVAYIGSRGLLEIAIRDGRADGIASKGTAVAVERA
jgi:S-adenosylmethionine hydrolase